MEFLNEFLKTSGINLPFASTLIYLLLVCLGAFANVVNIVYMKKECESIVCYFNSKPKATATMMMGILLGWIGLLQVNETSLLTYIMTGFVCDSIFNRFASGNAGEQARDKALAGAGLNVDGQGRSEGYSPSPRPDEPPLSPPPRNP